MNGNGTTQATQDGGETAPVPPSWAHDFLPASWVFDCQGPDCDSAARAYWTGGPKGFVAPGWQVVEDTPYCSWLCVARYAAARSQEQVDAMKGEPVPPAGRRTRHNG